MGRLPVIAALGYLAASVAFYARPLAALRRGARARPSPARRPTPPPYIWIVSACRDGAACLPGLAATFRAQDYPPDRFRVSIVADNCTDDTAATARSLGMDTLERHDRRTAGKGNAISEFTARRLRLEPFDVLVVVDVDGRVEPTFLGRVASWFTGTPLVLSFATHAANPAPAGFARTGELIQSLLRLHQEGRSALGRPAFLFGSHGYALSRDALEKLGWRTTTGLVGEDMELRLRSTLAGIPVRYAPDIAMYNDVTADFRSALHQRRRWNATYAPLARRYAGSLARRRDWDSLFGVLLLPGPGNLFLALLSGTAGLMLVSRRSRRLRPYAGASAALLAADVGYFLAAFRHLGIRLGRPELEGFALHIGMRILAFAQSLFLMNVRDWSPAPHEGTR